MRHKNREITLNNSNIRCVKAADLPFLIDVVDNSGLFPGDMLEPMIGDSLEDEASQAIWLTYETESPVAVAYLAPERMTSGTWNLYLIAVHSDHQGQGIGAKLMGYVENLLRSRDQRILVVETSDLDEFARTRRFYTDIGYSKEAHIREFYDEGEGKVIFWKKLS